MFRIQLYLALLIGYFFLRNFSLPLFYDDYAYAFIWDGEQGGNLIDGIGERHRVESLSDVLHSQFSHYFTWGGRAIAHSFAQIFIWIGKPYFDVVNTIFFTAFIILVLKLTNTKFKNSAFAIGWIFFILFFIAAKFLGTVIWMTWLTGACNYFWTTIFQLTFLLPYVNAIRFGKADDSTLKIFLMTIAGILAGFSNESGGLATIFLTAILVLLSARKKFLRRWMLTGMATLILGSALCILAPGNFVQTEYIKSVSPVFNFGPQLLQNNFLNGFLPLFCLDLLALLPTIMYFFKRGFFKLKTSDTLIILFAAAGFIVPLSMIFSPKFDYSRISMISLPFMIISAVAAYAELQKLSWKFSFPFAFRKGFFIICCVYAVSILYAYNIFNCSWENQISYIIAHKNEDTIYLPPLPPLTTTQKILQTVHGMDCPIELIKHFGRLTPYKNNSYNILNSQYYGVKNIVVSE